jgi:hypothetical protein
MINIYDLINNRLTIKIIDRATNKEILELDNAVALSCEYSRNVGSPNTTEVKMTLRAFMMDKPALVGCAIPLIKSECAHNWDTYHGLEETYSFCKHCGTKK